MPTTITDNEASVLYDLVMKAAERHDGARFMTGEYIGYKELAEKLAADAGDQ